MIPFENSPFETVIREAVVRLSHHDSGNPGSRGARRSNHFASPIRLNAAGMAI